tara:strand:- start:29540 stop:29797 length:258 start_codon:yes stop_codon:yes gene_type:complete
VVLWPGDLVKRIGLVVLVILVALVAVVVLVRVSLMSLHLFLRVERLIAVFIRAFDTLEGLQFCRHVGSVALMFQMEFVTGTLGAL